jgi:hypothetical protein
MNIIYVDEDAAGAEDGTSWTDAFTKLQDALAVAVSGDEIWVAEGIYKPDQGTGRTPGSRTETFVLPDGVKMYGGFTGTETGKSQRDYANNLTVLSGDIGASGVDTDNTYNIITSNGNNGSTHIDGFTITCAYANGAGWPRYEGGGIYIYGYSNITLYNCIFTENYADRRGAGVSATSSNPTFTNCEFKDSSLNADGDSEGGAAWLYMCQANTLFDHCRFLDNEADYGGAVAVRDGYAAFSHCKFVSNTAIDSGGAVWGYFGGPAFTNCLFIDNSADVGGAEFFYDHSDPTHVNCTFTANTATSDAGGIYALHVCDPSFVNCILWANTDSGGSDQSAQLYEQDMTAADVRHSCIQDADPDDGSIPFGGTPNNNIDDNPSFLDAAAENYSLAYDSPCIELGDNAAASAISEDLDGRYRFRDGDCDGDETVDMGAYECNWLYAGDLDEDCDVDFADVSIMSLNWLAGK